MKRNGSIVAYLLRGKIAQWEKDNMVRIDSILEKMKQIDTEFWQHNVVDGRIEFVKVDGEDGKREPVLIEGKTREEFESKYKELLSTETTMIL